MELDILAKLEIATASLHEDINNFEKQGEVNRLREVMGTIESRKAKGAAVKSRVKWQQVGDKCSKEFFRSVRPKNTQTVISEIKDRRGRIFTKREDLEGICHNFYQDLYAHKEITEEAMAKALEGFSTTFPPAIIEAISKEITEEELGHAVTSMAKRKAPGHDGIPTEYFQKLWSTIGKDLHLMILNGMREGKLHEGVTKGLISLISKEGDSKDLNYWRPITLLPVTYKIFAKLLQTRLQPMLRDVISLDQTAFLPLRFILDNIVLTQETLHWARTSKQPTIFLKLDFSKAYDKVSWHFLFKAMKAMDICEEFIKWVKLLFTNASAAVNLNGTLESHFKIERGVRQGCPLAPYLFLIVGEVLIHMVKKAVDEGRLRGVYLPGGKKQHYISQYADDSSFMVRGTKEDVDEFVKILETFSEASGMEINWEKSSAYWFDRHIPKSEWLLSYNWKWAEEGDLSKLLGTPFGLNLDTKDIDQFLYNKIAKKFVYWRSMKLSLAGRIVICNQVLLSTLWFFITVWGGSNKALRRIRGAI